MMGGSACCEAVKFCSKFAMKPSQAKNLYEILEIDKTASSEEIDNAFRKQAFLWHPDKQLDDYEAGDAEFKILMNAYCILSDPARRRDYDRYHFNKSVYPNYGNYRDERLTIYRARQRAIINKMLNKNNRIMKNYKSLARYCLGAMIACAGLFFYMLFFRNQNIAQEHNLGRYIICLPLILFNGALICHVIAKMEMIDVGKRNRSLAIRLYSHIDEQ
jgi:hypothetical protein